MNRSAGMAVTLAALAVAAAARLESQASVVIRDVTVVDVDAGALRPHMTVIIAGRRITQVVAATAAKAPRGARVIDGRGRWLIPGLWDMHSHSLWSLEAMRSFLPLYVTQGVTGIRDMGGTLPVLDAFRDSVKRADPAWPRVIAAGMIIDGPKPVQAEISIGVADSAGAVAAVDSLARAHVDFIKVYTLLPRDAYLATIAEAHRKRLAVVGHVPASVTPEEAARAGQRSFEHLRDEIEPFCSRDQVADCEHLAAAFRAEHTWQVPTLVVLHAKAYFDDSAMATDQRLRYLPPSLRADWMAERAAKIKRGGAYAERKRATYATEVWLTGFLAHEKVPLLAGTDAGVAFAYPGFSLHDELGLMVGAGLTPLEALRTATIAPAEYLAARDSMGAIAAGQVADLVLLRSDPLAKISATREIEAVILRGRVFDRRTLDAMLDSVVAAASR